MKTIGLVFPALLLVLAGCTESETPVSVRLPENKSSSVQATVKAGSQDTQVYQIDVMDNPCNGELITTTGTITISSKTVIRPDGGCCMSYHLSTNQVNGIGQTTGTRYQIKENSNYFGTWDGTSSSSSQEITFRVNAFSATIPDFKFKFCCNASLDPTGAATLSHYCQKYLCK